MTKGLYQKYGDRRVVDSPITEMGFTGLAIGAAYQVGIKYYVKYCVGGGI